MTGKTAEKRTRGGMQQKANLSGAFTRRQFIATGIAGFAAFATSTLIPDFALAAVQMPATRALAFRSLHTGEEVKATYLRDNILQPEAVKTLNHVLRDWRASRIFNRSGNKPSAEGLEPRTSAA
jgi:uncharacterized protein YcbK (DUF882 family)